MIRLWGCAVLPHCLGLSSPHALLLPYLHHHPPRLATLLLHGLQAHDLSQQYGLVVDRTERLANSLCKLCLVAQELNSQPHGFRIALFAGQVVAWHDHKWSGVSLA